MRELFKKKIFIAACLVALASDAFAAAHFIGPAAGPAPCAAEASAVDVTKPGCKAKVQSPPDSGDMHVRIFKRHLDRLDTNKDGRISRAETMADTDRRFAEIDTDGDNFITEEEMRESNRKIMSDVGKRTRHERPLAPEAMPALK